MEGTLFAKKAYLGIDVGTQGLSVLLVSEDCSVLGDGFGSYDMIADLGHGHYEQNPAGWERALAEAMVDLRKKLSINNVALYNDINDPAKSDQCINILVAGIGIAGQMHGEVIADCDYRVLCPARLWCDGRNDLESAQLTEALAVKCPKRLTACRWLYTVRTKPASVVVAAKHLTTPAGWIAFKLTGEWTLGIGDASGMFPVNQSTLDYHAAKLDVFDVILNNAWRNNPEYNSSFLLPKFESYLPKIRVAGQTSRLSSNGASLLGLKEGIIVAPAEGDQPAALAGSLIGKAGQVSMSLGTSVVCNSVCDRAFDGISRNIDHFCAVDGKPINMVWLRNGTTPMNMIIDMFGSVLSPNTDPFSVLMPLVVGAADDCDGIIALPFMDDEPNMGVLEGGSCGMFGLNKHNCTPGNMAKTMLLSTLFNLRVGCDVLEAQGFRRDDILLSGGATKTTQLGQVVADVFNTAVTLTEAASEGCAFGAALLARFSHQRSQQSTVGEWTQFLQNIGTFLADKELTRFLPREPSVRTIENIYAKHCKLLSLHKNLADVNNG